MPLYQYRCDTCLTISEYVLASTAPAKVALDTGTCRCDDSGCPGHLRRRFTPFALSAVFEGEYNHSAGTYVSSKRALDDANKRASEAATLRTGVEHNFVAHDTREVSAADLGVTSEGLGATHDAQVAAKMKPATGKTVF